MTDVQKSICADLATSEFCQAYLMSYERQAIAAALARIAELEAEVERLRVPKAATT